MALYKYATPTPIAISVNMLGFRNFTEPHPRWKNGQPAHSTIGVARQTLSRRPCAVR